MCHVLSVFVFVQYPTYANQYIAWNNNFSGRIGVSIKSKFKIKKNGERRTQIKYDNECGLFALDIFWNERQNSMNVMKNDHRSSTHTHSHFIIISHDSIIN